MISLEFSYLMLAGFILISYTTQTLTGFGSTIIALTLGANFFPIMYLLPILVPLSLVLNGYIAVRSFSSIDYRLLFIRLIPAMGLGMIIGYLIYQRVSGDLLKKIFGGLVVVLASKELVDLIFSHKLKSSMSFFKNIFWIFASGITHGMYASGGPLLVYSLGGLKLNKNEFRANLSAVLFLLNSFLVIFYFKSGQISFETLKFSGLYLPVVITGIFIGELFHKKISERKFKILIYSLLIFIGLVLIV